MIILFKIYLIIVNTLLRDHTAYENDYNHQARSLPGENKPPNTWQKHGVVLLDSVVEGVVGEELETAEVLVVCLGCEVPAVENKTV